MRLGGTLPSKILYIKQERVSEFGGEGHHLAPIPLTNGHRTFVYVVDDEPQAKELILQHSRGGAISTSVEKNTPITNLRLVGKGAPNQLFLSKDDGTTFMVGDDVITEAAANSSIVNGVLSGSYVWGHFPRTGLAPIRVGSLPHRRLCHSHNLRNSPLLSKKQLSPGDVCQLRNGRVNVYLGQYNTIPMSYIGGKLVPGETKSFELWYKPRQYALSIWDGVGPAPALNLYTLDLQRKLQEGHCAGVRAWDGFKLTRPDAVAVIGHTTIPSDLDKQISECYLTGLRQMQLRQSNYGSGFVLQRMASWSWGINISRSGILPQVHSIYDAANILI